MKPLWLIVLGLCAPLLAQDSVGVLELTAGGPLGSMRALSGAQETRVELDLQAGEQTSLRLPVLSLRNRLQAAEPVVTLDTAGSGEAEALGVQWPRPWRELPLSLQSRPLPPVQRSSPAIGLAQWSVLLASVLWVLALRRRPWFAMGLGLLGGTLLLLGLPASPPAEGAQVRVLEGESGGQWLEVRGGRERLLVRGVTPGWLQRVPSRGELRLEFDASEPGEWTACFDEGRLFFTRELGFLGPTSAGPGESAFASCWVRRNGEGWTFHGPWSGNQPLSPPEAGPLPPGWLVAGLPQGLEILVGKLESGRGESAWLRLVGFE